MSIFWIAIIYTTVYSSVHFHEDWGGSVLNMGCYPFGESCSYGNEIMHTASSCVHDFIAIWRGALEEVPYCAILRCPIEVPYYAIEEVPYCFSRSSVKFQGHTALKIAEFDPDWAFPDCNSSLNSPMATKWCTKLEVALKRCPIVFQGHPSNFKVTRL